MVAIPEKEMSTCRTPFSRRSSVKLTGCGLISERGAREVVCHHVVSFRLRPSSTHIARTMAVDKNTTTGGGQYIHRLNREFTLSYDYPQAGYIRLNIVER